MPSAANLPKLLIYYEREERARQLEAFVKERFPQLPVTVALRPEEAFAAVADTEIVVGWGTPEGLLRQAPRLRWVHKLGAGVDDFMLGDELPEHVVLTRTDGGVFAERMAEYCIAYMLAFCQNSLRIFRQQSRREWRPFLTETIADKTVGVAGVGDIGSAVARKAAALGARVVGWRRSPGDVEAIDHMYVGPDEFFPFLRESDFVVIVLPLTPATKGLFDEAALNEMRDGAYLVNVGRGPIVVESALVDALRRGKLGGAALDVFDVEPLPADNPLWELDNVIITPHMSGPSLAPDVAGPLLNNLERYLQGKPLHKVVDRGRAY